MKWFVNSFLSVSGVDEANERTFYENLDPLTRTKKSSVCIYVSTLSRSKSFFATNCIHPVAQLEAKHGHCV